MAKYFVVCDISGTQKKMLICSLTIYLTSIDQEGLEARFSRSFGRGAGKRTVSIIRVQGPARLYERESQRWCLPSYDGKPSYPVRR